MDEARRFEDLDKAVLRQIEDAWPCGNSACLHPKNEHDRHGACRFEDCLCQNYYEAPDPPEAM